MNQPQRMFVDPETAGERYRAWLTLRERKAISEWRGASMRWSLRHQKGSGSALLRCTMPSRW